MKDIVIVDGARTPMAEYNGHFSDTSAIDLAAVAGREALSRSGFSGGEIDHVIVGNALQTSGDAIYGARHVGLKSGVPEEVPALTVNRLCGSGIQSIISGAEQILLDEAKTVLAGGMENMSQAPHVIRGARKGFKLGQGAIEDSLMVALLDSYCNLYMAQTAENLAQMYDVSRADMDEFGVRSQNLAEKAIADGFWANEITPVPLPDGSLAETDDGPRAGVTYEAVSQLQPVFRPDGVVTAGNCCPLNDGAAAVVVMSDTKAAELGLTPLARIVSTGVSALSPEIMGLGPVEASKQALQHAGVGGDAAWADSAARRIRS